MMSGLQIYPHGKQTPASFTTLSCLRPVFKEQVIHGRWLPAEQLRIHIHVKFNIADDIQFSQAAMMRVVNKKFPLVSMDPANILEDTDGKQLKVYWHSFQIKKRSNFFWITRADRITPPSIIPSQRNALNWEEDCVLKRLIIGARRAHVLTIDMTIEPQVKRKKKKRRKGQGSKQQSVILSHLLGGNLVTLVNFSLPPAVVDSMNHRIA